MIIGKINIGENSVMNGMVLRYSAVAVYSKYVVKIC